MSEKTVNQSDNAAALDEHASKELLASYGIPVVTGQKAGDEDAAVAAAQAIGYPVVLKGAGPKLLHKTEKNLVHLHLADAGAVRSAARQIARSAGRDLSFFLVQPHLSGRRELMAGFHRDRQFGPVIVFGVGGVLTEVLDDITLGLAPLTQTDCRNLINGIRARGMLSSFRGEPPVDSERLAAVLKALSDIAMENPDIREIDINPLKVTPDGGICAVDALVVRESLAKNPPDRPTVDTQAIQRLFHPQRIAFIGASSKIGKWGHFLTVNTLDGGYEGEVLLVNAKGGTILGRQVYQNLRQIPGKVDLAVVTVPASAALAVLDACHEKQIRHMVMITSGFGETGSTGRDLESELVARARKYGITILGPNTMGMANPHIRLFCTGATVTPQAGGTAMVSQSGNMGTQLLAFAEKQGIGIRCFAGSGNEAMIAMEDYLECFEKDTLTRSVLLYVESVKNGRRFFESARRIGLKKPIVLLKGGQTDAGGRAAASHTGAMASDNRVFNAMCRQAGIVKVEHPMALLDLAAAFASLPLPKGGRTAIMTWGGGWGVVTADLCQAQDLQVPTLDSGIIDTIDARLPDFWSRTNPVDMVGEQDPSAAFDILETLMAWEGCDAVINLGILGRRLFTERSLDAAVRSDPDVDEKQRQTIITMMADFEQAFIDRSTSLMQKYQKPIIGVSLLPDEQHRSVYPSAKSRYSGVFYETPERAVTVLSQMVAYHRFVNTHQRTEKV